MGEIPSIAWYKIGYDDEFLEHTRLRILNLFLCVLWAALGTGGIVATVVDLVRRAGFEDVMRPVSYDVVVVSLLLFVAAVVSSVLMIVKNRAAVVLEGIVSILILLYAFAFLAFVGSSFGGEWLTIILSASILSIVTLVALPLLWRFYGSSS